MQNLSILIISTESLYSSPIAAQKRGQSSSYLIRLKGFLNLLEAREQANIGADLVHSGAQTGEDVHEFAVQLAGVRLTGDRPDSRKSRLLRHQLV